ncbi:MAG: DMT family transporter [Eubacteriales bacterium]|nr:DMT family transporter [Eubacteriales bacterium]
MKNNRQLVGHILAIFTALVWGTTFVSSKVLLREFTPVELLFDRFLLGYLALWLMKPGILRVKEKRHELMFAGAGLTGVCLYYLFENLALTYTQAANVSVIVSTAPLFVSIMAHFFLKEEPLQKSFFYGFACAILGIVLLSFGGGEMVSVNLTGDMMCVLGAILWGAYSIFIKKANGFGYSVIQTTRRVFFYGILFMIPIVAVSGYRMDVGRFMTGINVANLLFLGIIACAVCFVSWNKAVDILGAVKTSAYIYAIPVITLIASVMILHEKITLMMGIGTALTVVGLIVSERGSEPHESEAVSTQQVHGL